jgi:hypothetical protein
MVMLAAACGHSTDIEASIRFADRSDAEIARLVSAATGTDAFSAQARALAFDDPFAESDCPQVAVDGSTVTLTGGCSMVDGATVEGTAIISNAFWGDIEPDFGDDQVYEFSQFAVVQLGFRTSYDGIVRITSFYTEIDADITVEMQGMTVRSDLFFDCDSGGCDLDGSGVELIGAGGAHVSGEIEVSGTRSGGGFTLRGEDTVRVDFDQGCLSWQLEGTERSFQPCP